MNKRTRLVCSVAAVCGVAALAIAIAITTSRQRTKEVAPSQHEKVMLWEGGPFWATTNIGAEKPWDYGLYFWWGDTIGYRYENNTWVASDGSSSNYSFCRGNTPTYDKIIDMLQSEGWITEDCVLTPEHDAAHVQWGGRWRMPTADELEDLCEKCDWTWTTQHGVNGYIVRGRGDYASRSIFLPCAGCGTETLFNDVLAPGVPPGSLGVYWSSVPRSAYNQVRSLVIRHNGLFPYHNKIYDDDMSYVPPRYAGCTVRPVLGFSDLPE